MTSARPGSGQPDSSLALLSEYAGIEPGYHDVQGVWHPADDAARAAVLEALGLPAATPEQCAASLAELQARRWASPLPPVCVLRPDDAREVTITHPDAAPTGPVHWRLILESGQCIEAEASLKAVPALKETLPPGLHAFSLRIPNAVPEGYHRLEMDGHHCTLIVAPAQCWLPPTLESGQKLWGVNCQLYTLRNQDDWGIGDFASLAELARYAAQSGAALLGINPLHALFPDQPEAASPYSPSSRLFLNPLYLSVPAIPEYADCHQAQSLVATASFQQQLAAVRAASHIDYAAVAALKIAVLQLLFEHFRKLPATHPRQTGHRHFCDDQGAVLQDLAAFHAWRVHHPAPAAQPTRTELDDFASGHPEAVGFQTWLQFESDRQLARIQQVFAPHRQPGLFRDLAVGSASDGADVWMAPTLYCSGTRIGAPPDPLGPRGQDWGLPPMNPLRLRDLAYAPFIRLLRANMRHAGALRIDHVMALQHLFLIPPGCTARDGVYVRYPFEDLLAIVALESQRHRCMVIGEDLGTVPSAFRERMREARILSYRLLYFERWESGLFKRPETYPALALATASSHDTSPLAGFWSGDDIALRAAAGTYPEHTDVGSERAFRARDRRMLLDALRDQQYRLEDDCSATAVISACHSFLASSPAGLLMLNLDDLAAETLPVNLPGTVDEYPNWRRRMNRTLAELFADAGVCAQIADLAMAGRTRLDPDEKVD